MEEFKNDNPYEPEQFLGSTQEGPPISNTNLQHQKVVALGHLLKRLTACIVDDSEGDDAKSSEIATRLCQQIKQQSLVEGHSESSYIGQMVSKIERKVRGNDFESARKEIDNIQQQIMPFDYQEFFRLFDATKRTAEQLQGKVCWVLLGPTGAGKSTTIHFLCGSTFKKSIGGSVVVDQPSPALRNKAIDVGENVIESQTRYIEAVPLNLAQHKIKGRGRCEPMEVLLVDSPGFEDTAGPEVNIANGIGTVRALQKAKSVKVIITVKEAHFDFKFKIVRSIANNMGMAIYCLSTLLDDANSPVAGFLTKSEHGVEEAQELLKKASKESSGASDSDDILFRALVYKLGETGPLFEVKIDVDSEADFNEKRRFDILQGLVKDAGYINAPSETFREFISASSLSKLKEQINLDYRAIINVLDRDTYFNDPRYLHYVIDLLHNMDELKKIIGKAGGKTVASKLDDCVSMLKEKWNAKFERAAKMLLDVQEQDVSALLRRLDEFDAISLSLERNAKTISHSPYYEALKDPSSLNQVLNKIFDVHCKRIMKDLQQIKSDSARQSGTWHLQIEEESNDSSVSSERNDQKEQPVVFQRNDQKEQPSSMASTASLEKCCLLYRRYQSRNKHIRKAFEKYQQCVADCMKHLGEMLDELMKQKTLQQEHSRSVPLLMFAYSQLSKLHSIWTSICPDCDSDGIRVLRTSVEELKRSITQCTASICGLYSLNSMPMPQPFETSCARSVSSLVQADGNPYVNVDALLQSKVIPTDDALQQREAKLVSFSAWLSALYDALLRSNIHDMDVFEDLKTLLFDVQSKWMEWICGACAEELRACNELLMTKGPQSWKDVEKLLRDCTSLRQIQQVANDTAQLYFKTINEFEYHRGELAKKAAEIIQSMNENDGKLKWEEIITIAGQLHGAGCSTESTEMKQLSNRIKQHVEELKGVIDGNQISVEMYEELRSFERVLHELNVLQKLVSFMPDIQESASNCYAMLTEQILQVLHEIESKYDLQLYSTRHTIALRDALVTFQQMKRSLNAEILNLITKCKAKTLKGLVDANDAEINKLNARNQALDNEMKAQSGTVMEELAKYEKMAKKGKTIMMNGENEDLKEFLQSVGQESLRTIRAKRGELEEQLKSCNAKQQAEKAQNVERMQQLRAQNADITPCIEAEQELQHVVTSGSQLIRYRTDDLFLQEKIKTLQQKTADNTEYIFCDKLVLFDAYNALNFLHKCSSIRWRNSQDLSNKTISSVHRKVTAFLTQYGNNMEKNLNDLLDHLKVTDISACDLNDIEYRMAIQKLIAKLNACLLELRDISSFDCQMKIRAEEYGQGAKPLSLVTALFNNHDIQISVDKYVNRKIANHKHELLLKFSQCKVHRVDKLPVLHFICLSMSGLDRFVTSSQQQSENESYMRIASQIDAELSKDGGDKSKQIMPLMQNRSYNQLRITLDDLKKTGAANKEGIGQRNYRDCVIKVFSGLNKLMNDTKSQLLTNISEDSEIKIQSIISLNQSLKDVNCVTEILQPHLDEVERKQVESEEAGLGQLLSRRLKQLMDAALKAVKMRDFKSCEKRLDNIQRLMENGIQFTDSISSDYRQIQKEIADELVAVMEQVQKANESLRDHNAFNPYNRLRLVSLHDQLSESSNHHFSQLWYNINDEIVTAIRDLLVDIDQSSNQLGMRSEYGHESKMQESMSHSQQEAYLRKIKNSLPYFPKEMKEIIAVMYEQARGNARDNVKIQEEEFQQAVMGGMWNDVARCLNEFQASNQKLYIHSRRTVSTKLSQQISQTEKKDLLQMTVTDDFAPLRNIGLHFTNLEFSVSKGSYVLQIENVSNQLQHAYQTMLNQFIAACKCIKGCLSEQREFADLKNGFAVLFKVMENCEFFTVSLAQSMVRCAQALQKPIQSLIKKLKLRVSKGLDKKNHDIECLVKVLNDLKALDAADLRASVSRWLQLEEVKCAESSLEIDTDAIRYEDTVQSAKSMLTEFKDNVSKQGINKQIIQQSQAKRLEFMKSMTQKMKALIKAREICDTHLEMKQQHFESEFISPCIDKLKADVGKMTKEVVEAFRADKLDPKALTQANANLQTTHLLKHVFESVLSKNQYVDQVPLDSAVTECEDAAIQRVEQLCKSVQVDPSKLTKDNIEGYVESTAESLLYLEYINKHIHFKTAIHDNESTNQSANEANEVQKHAERVIKDSMQFLAQTPKTKAKMNVLYNRLIEQDCNYGSVFTQQHSAFKASLAESMNQKFRELDIAGIIRHLKQSEQELAQHKRLLGVNYERVQTVFDRVKNKYTELVMTNLRKVTSFKAMEQEIIPRLSNDAKNAAASAVGSRRTKLDKVLAVGSYVKDAVCSSVSWFFSQGQKPAAAQTRQCYWTSEMKQAIPDLVAYILAVWTLKDAECFYDCDDQKENALRQPRNAQIIAICSILCLDIDTSESGELLNNLVEVGTGEGKSVIMAVTAIVLALLEFDVYCACYSELLSNRDQEAFESLFMQFGVEKHVRYQTFNKIFEEIINDDGDVREMAKSIVLSEGDDDHKADGNAVAAKSKLYRRQKILFIDEVDKFFSTDFFGKQYTPSCTIPKTEIKDLIRWVWAEYLQSGSRGSDITISKVEQSEQFQKVLAVFKQEWHDLLKESVKDMIDAIRTFQGRSYKIENGRDIAYKFSDSYSTKVFFGYRTLFTYLYELENGNITDHEHVDAKLTWFIKCGSFLYSEIPNDFYSILGVTGTLKSLSLKEHQVMQESYGIRKYVVMPSLFDKSGKLQYACNRDIDVFATEYYHNQLHSTLQAYQKNDIESVERPIIAIFKDEDALQYFFHLEVCKEWSFNERIQVLTPDLSENEKKLRILKATKANQITFATEEYGRGIDFQVFDKKFDLKGMHVELCFWPDTLAEEIQIKGRTARQGQKGSFHITLNQDEIVDQYCVSKEEIESHKNDGDLYEWLNGIRKTVFAAKYDQAASYVAELRPTHRQSEALVKSLRERNVAVAKEKLLMFNQGANVQSAAKLSILIDATGSMASCLSQCKIVIQKTIPKLVDFCKSNGISSDSFEMQVVAYRNYNATADKILEFCPFTADVNELTKFVHSLQASYGRGEEAVELAFNQLNRQEKKPNIVLLMADASAQTKEDIIYKRNKYYKENYWQTELDGRFQKTADWKEELNEFMANNTDAIVYPFYLTQRAKQNFEEIAQIGKGKAHSLNVRNEKQSVGLLQSALSETILFKVNNGSMEYVEKFRQQHSNMPQFL